MKLEFLEPTYSICRLPPEAELPQWATDTFLVIARTDNELSIISPTHNVPAGITAQHDFTCFRVTGELAFDVIGVISEISKVLADAKIPILSISTYNTDYFLVSKTNRESARLALSNASYELV